MNHYWLALSKFPGVGSITIRRWLDYFGSIDQLFLAHPTDLEAAGIPEKHQHLFKAINWQRIENDLTWLEKNNSHILTWNDQHYPTLLKEIHDPPFLLYVQGNVSLLKELQIAIVGSRYPSITGKELAQQFAKELAKAGLVITSGLALGIDAASHAGALAAQGKTIAILGTGLKLTYPPTHQMLAEQIVMNNGALVSEFPLDTPPKAPNFPMRNRIISGLSLGVLVVEAALKSGSLITARQALEQNREVFAIPSSIHNPLAKGCHQLIRQGAKLVETAKDILEEINFPLKQQEKDTPLYILRKEPVDLDPIFQRVLAQIGYEVTALDAIILRSQLTAAEVSSMLLSLELKGYVKVVPGGYIRIE